MTVSRPAELLPQLRDLARNDLREQAARSEAASAFPRDLITELGRAGVLGLPFPRELGGGGWAFTSYLEALEILASGWLTVAETVAVHALASYPIAAFGTPAQQRDLLGPLLAGEVLGAYALSEPDAGSDAAALATLATLDGGHYRVTGTKAWITHAGHAGLYNLFVRTGGPGPDGISCLAADASTPGLSTARPEDKMGLRASPVAQVLLDDARIPVDRLVGRPGQGFRIAMSALNLGRLGIAACATGLASAALELAVDYAASRTQFGKPIAEFQGTGFTLADMATAVEAGRALYQSAARRRDAGQDTAKDAAMAKLFCTDTAMAVTTHAVQILGAVGYTTRYPAERYMREAKVLQIFEGTNQIQRLVISRRLPGRAHQARERRSIRNFRLITRRGREHPSVTAEGPSVRLNSRASRSRRRSAARCVCVPPCAGQLRAPGWIGAMPAYDAFLLLSFGGPEGPDDVMPFLENVTRGRGVPAGRLAEVAEHYHAHRGVSPINAQCRDLLAAVKAAGLGLPAYWGNRNWHPFLEDTVRQMAADGVRRAVAFVTSAYSSYSACRQYLDDIDRAVAAVGPRAPRIDKIRPYFNHPGFIEPFAANVEAALATLPAGAATGARLVFTAHSVPAGMAASSGSRSAGTARPAAAGGRYAAELSEAARLISERTLGGSLGYDLVWQSRSGPPSVPWLEPDVCDHLETLAKSGDGPAVVVVPAGFVTDHMEVVHDLDVEAAGVAASLGLPFARAKAPGTSRRFARMVCELVAERTSGAAPAALGDFGPAPGDCPADCCRYARQARPA